MDDCPETNVKVTAARTNKLNAVVDMAGETTRLPEHVLTALVFKGTRSRCQQLRRSAVDVPVLSPNSSVSIRMRTSSAPGAMLSIESVDRVLDNFNVGSPLNYSNVLR